MSITLLDGNTIAATGGTGKAFSLDGRQVQNGRIYSDSTEFDIRKRDYLTLTNVPERPVNGGQQYTKGRRMAKIHVHDVDPAGVPYEAVNISILVTKDVRCSAAKLAIAVNRACQTQFDAEMANFNTVGTLPD